MDLRSNKLKFTCVIDVNEVVADSLIHFVQDINKFRSFNDKNEFYF